MIGGSVGLKSFKQEKNKPTNLIMLEPRVGHFFANNFAVGVELNTILWDETALGISPFIRGYSGAEGFFLEANYTYQRFEGEGFNTIGGKIGYSAFLNDFVALEPALDIQIGDFILDTEVGPLTFLSSKSNLTKINFGLTVQVFLNRGTE